MDEKKFQEIIKFAIDKEIKSFNFYTNASQVAKYSGAKDLFSDLAQARGGPSENARKARPEKNCPGKD